VTRDELVARLKGYEWTDFECKKAQRSVPRDTYSTVSAFANTEGGWLLFGVSEVNGQLIRQRLDQHQASPATTYVKNDLEDGPPTSAGQVGTKLAPSQHQVEILHKCLKERALLELMVVAGRSDRTKFRHQVLNPLLEEGLIEMTIPDKPRSSKQKYRLTHRGRQYLEQSK
jgi:predicted HTH transcriptional regulator